MSAIEKVSWVAGIVSAGVAVVVWISQPSSPIVQPSENTTTSGGQTGVTNIQMTGGTLALNGPNTSHQGTTSSSPLPAPNMSAKQSPPENNKNLSGGHDNLPAGNHQLKEGGWPLQLTQATKPLGNYAPSFDCEKATYQSEKIVCSSEDLSALDVKMTNKYKMVAELMSEGDKLALRKQQNHWLRVIREQCSDISCMKTVYENRINELILHEVRFMLG